MRFIKDLLPGAAGGGGGLTVEKTWDMSAQLSEAVPVSENDTNATSAVVDANNQTLTPDSSLPDAGGYSFTSTASNVLEELAGSVKVHVPVIETGDNLSLITLVFIPTTANTETWYSDMTLGNEGTYGIIVNISPSSGDVEALLVIDGTQYTQTVSGLASQGTDIFFNVDRANNTVNYDTGSGWTQILNQNMDALTHDYQVGVLEMFSSQSPVLTNGPLTFDLGSSEGGRTPLQVRGDASLPSDADDGIPFEVTHEGPYKGKRGFVGDVAFLANGQQEVYFIRSSFRPDALDEYAKLADLISDRALVLLRREIYWLHPVDDPSVVNSGPFGGSTFEPKELPPGTAIIVGPNPAGPFADFTPGNLAFNDNGNWGVMYLDPFNNMVGTQWNEGKPTVGWRYYGLSSDLSGAIGTEALLTQVAPGDAADPAGEVASLDIPYNKQLTEDNDMDVVGWAVLYTSEEQMLDRKTYDTTLLDDQTSYPVADTLMANTVVEYSIGDSSADEVTIDPSLDDNNGNAKTSVWATMLISNASGARDRIVTIPSFAQQQVVLEPNQTKVFLVTANARGTFTQVIGDLGNRRIEHSLNTDGTTVSVPMATNVHLTGTDDTYDGVSIELPTPSEAPPGGLVYIHTDKELTNITWPVSGFSVEYAPTNVRANSVIVFALQRNASGNRVWYCISNHPAPSDTLPAIEDWSLDEGGVAIEPDPSTATNADVTENGGDWEFTPNGTVTEIIPSSGIYYAAVSAPQVVDNAEWAFARMDIPTNGGGDNWWKVLFTFNVDGDSLTRTAEKLNGQNVNPGDYAFALTIDRTTGDLQFEWVDDGVVDTEVVFNNVISASISSIWMGVNRLTGEFGVGIDNGSSTAVKPASKKITSTNLLAMSLDISMGITFDSDTVSFADGAVVFNLSEAHSGSLLNAEYTNIGEGPLIEGEAFVGTSEVDSLPSTVADGVRYEITGASGGRVKGTRVYQGDVVEFINDTNDVIVTRKPLSEARVLTTSEAVRMFVDINRVSSIEQTQSTQRTDIDANTDEIDRVEARVTALSEARIFTGGYIAFDIVGNAVWRTTPDLLRRKKVDWDTTGSSDPAVSAVYDISPDNRLVAYLYSGDLYIHDFANNYHIQVATGTGAGTVARFGKNAGRLYYSNNGNGSPLCAKDITFTSSNGVSLGDETVIMDGATYSDVNDMTIDNEGISIFSEKLYVATAANSGSARAVFEVNANPSSSDYDNVEELFTPSTATVKALALDSYLGNLAAALDNGTVSIRDAGSGNENDSFSPGDTVEYVLYRKNPGRFPGHPSAAQLAVTYSTTKDFDIRDGETAGYPVISGAPTANGGGTMQRAVAYSRDGQYMVVNDGEVYDTDDWSQITQAQALSGVVLWLE